MGRSAVQSSRARIIFLLVLTGRVLDNQNGWRLVLSAADWSHNGNQAKMATLWCLLRRGLPHFNDASNWCGFFVGRQDDVHEALFHFHPLIQISFWLKVQKIESGQQHGGGGLLFRNVHPRDAIIIFWQLHHLIRFSPNSSGNWTIDQFGKNQENRSLDGVECSVTTEKWKK